MCHLCCKMPPENCIIMSSFDILCTTVRSCIHAHMQLHCGRCCFSGSSHTYLIKCCKDQLQHMCRAAICISYCCSQLWCMQAVWTGHRAMQLVKRLRAATVLQKLWRGRAARSQMQRAQQAAICLQASWKCHVHRRQFLHKRACLIKVCTTTCAGQAHSKTCVQGKCCHCFCQFIHLMLLRELLLRLLQCSTPTNTKQQQPSLPASKVLL